MRGKWKVGKLRKTRYFDSAQYDKWVDVILNKVKNLGLSFLSKREESLRSVRRLKPPQYDGEVVKLGKIIKK